MPEVINQKTIVRSGNFFPVVGIGASAGGLDAFKRLLKAIPENSGMAYILVQHLDPAHESILAELLQRITKIPVQEITDNMEVVPDHIYIIPSNKLLTATDGVLQLSARHPQSQKNRPIDLFFASLAEVHQSHAIGVVLSGTGTDGTLGLKAIKDRGGITFAQDQQSASYDAMPQSAIDGKVVDYILAPEKIPPQLLALNVNGSFQLSLIEEDGNISQVQEEGFRKILALLVVRRDVDFTNYKQTTIRRRITRRVALCMKQSIDEYLVYLEENTAEQDMLYQDLLIPVTQFFRDPKIFETLSEKVLPALFKDRPASEPLRIWIAGCSTGEEAYSIVMCIHEYLGHDLYMSKIQVFATDISETAIAKARSGLYKKSEIAGISPARLHKFFTRVDGQFQINKFIRDICVFAYHNYLKDPPFAKMDFITCRNSLIYIQPVLQKKALATFHYALKEKGLLLLGKSETTGQVPELFTAFDKNNKIYSRKAASGRFPHPVGGRKGDAFKVGNYGVRKADNNKDDFQKNADDVLLSRYAPPGVVVNNEMDIVQFRGATGVWLEPSPGKPNLNVLKMARDGLAFELRNALHKVKSSKEALVKEDIPMQFMGGERLVTIEVLPLLNTAEPHYLILFREGSPPVAHGITKGMEGKLPTPKQSRELARVRELQDELAQAREDMRSISEDQEAFNEELQSANEELLSGSEELQSLNEELETSKEETQTSNEELIIINQELNDRNEQLNLSRLYAESIVTTIREPLIILNKNLHVKSANQSFYNKFQTSARETDGRPLFELGNRQWDIPAFRMVMEKILPEKTSIIDFELMQNFAGIGERILLLNVSRIVRDNTDEQSILLAIEDITEKRKIELELKFLAEGLEQQISERTFSLKEANIDLQHSNKNLEQFAYVASHDLQEPLRKIRVFSTMLRDQYNDALPDGARELIGKINISSERMTTLIKELLDFSKVLHGNAIFQKTNLDDIMSKIINDFDLLISEKNAVVHFERLPSIEAVPVQINQIFYNLLSNSLKFLKKGTAPVITITSKTLAPEELANYKSLNPKLTYCEISFRDNGIGFEQQYAEQIFLIFNRLHGRHQFPGTGIGLALCKTIVVNHHGDIDAISVKGEGTLFRIVLPLMQ